MQDGWYQCFYTAMAYLFIMVGNRSSEFVFPTYGPIAVKDSGDDNDSSSSKVSDRWSKAFDSLLDLHEQYMGLTQRDDCEEGESQGDLPPVGSPRFHELLKEINKELGSHHGKKGANMKMAESPAAGVPQCYRSGWMTRSIGTLFDYIIGTIIMDVKCGKVLAGWTDDSFGGSIFGGYPPETSDLVDETEKFAPFVTHLFSGVDGYGRPLLETLAMTVLLRLDDMIIDIEAEPFGKYSDPKDHPFVGSIDRARSASGISESTFTKWKKSARDGFMQRNRPSLPINFDPTMRDVLIDPRSLYGAYNQLAQQVATVIGKYLFAVTTSRCSSLSNYNAIACSIQADNAEIMRQNNTLIRENRAKDAEIHGLKVGQCHMSNQLSQMAGQLTQMASQVSELVVGRTGGLSDNPPIPAVPQPPPIAPLHPQPQPAAQQAAEVVVAMKFSQYIEWKNQLVKDPVTQFADWFIHSLEQGYEVDKQTQGNCEVPLKVLCCVPSSEAI